MIMNSLSNKNDSFCPADLAIIESFSYRSSPESGSADLIIEALFQKQGESASWPDWQKEFQKRTLKFLNIQKLSIRELTGPVQVMGFTIEDLSEKKWDSINFEISDYESGIIHFYCEEIQIL